MCEKSLQFKGLVPGGVEATLDGLGLLFGLIARVWDQFELHVGVRESVGVHGHKIPALFDWRTRETEELRIKHKKTESVTY